MDLHGCVIYATVMQVTCQEDVMAKKKKKRGC